MLLFSHIMNQPSRNVTSETAVRSKFATDASNLAQLVTQAAENQLRGLQQGKAPQEVLPTEPVTMVNVDSINSRSIPRKKQIKINPPTQTVTKKPEPLFIPQPDSVYQLDDLPKNLTEQLPQLTYNAHLYSPDLSSARMIMVNDKKYSEKDSIQEDLKIDQITPEGVIYLF